MLNNNLPLEEDRIRSMFAQRSLFITGGTGFMGKVLVEKLLRYHNFIVLYCFIINTMVLSVHGYRTYR